MNKRIKDSPRSAFSDFAAPVAATVGAVILLAAVAFSSLVTAQTRSANLASITGQVLSANGKPVGGALVILETSDGRAPHSTHTDDKGNFSFPNLRPGLYDLHAQAGEKWSEWQHNLAAHAGQPTEITLRLTLQKPPAAAVPQVRLTGKIREWAIPVENSLPHDPAVDPSGNVWLTLQRANQIARFNPKTAQWKLFLSPTQNSGPHGITSDARGIIWYTENSAGKIARLDPATGAILEYATLKATDPHTPIFGPDGALWFTAQQANLIGRLDTETAAIQEYRVPTPNARPYGIVNGPDGALWFCEFGANKLGRIDVKTGAITEFATPLPEERPRRLTVVGQMIYFTDFAAGHLGRFDTEHFSFKDWPSPSGDRSEPYGIVADSSGDIWYCEFSANQLVHFSPNSETFQRFTLPSAKSEVRNMVRDSTGRLWLALSGANKVAVVE